MKDINKIKIRYFISFILIELFFFLIMLILANIKIKRNIFPVDLILIFIILSTTFFKFIYKEYRKKYIEYFVKDCRKNKILSVKNAEFFNNYTTGYIDYFKNKVRINLRKQTNEENINIKNIISIENNKFKK